MFNLIEENPDNWLPGGTTELWKPKLFSFVGWTLGSSPAWTGHIFAQNCQNFQHDVHNYRTSFSFSFKNCNRKSGIYIIYIGSRRAIYNDIPASTSGKKLPRAARRALGNFFALGFGAISLYIALRDPIYTLHISKGPFESLQFYWFSMAY